MGREKDLDHRVHYSRSWKSSCGDNVVDPWEEFARCVFSCGIHGDDSYSNYWVRTGGTGMIDILCPFDGNSHVLFFVWKCNVDSSKRE